MTRLTWIKLAAGIGLIVLVALWPRCDTVAVDGATARFLFPQVCR